MNPDLDFIDRYLLNRLSKSELKVFNERLGKDRRFEQLFHELKLLRHAVRSRGIEKVRNRLKEQEARIQHMEKQKTSFGMKKSIPLAAGLLLMITLSYFALFNNNTEPITGQELYTAYYDGPYMNVVSGAERGAATTEESLSSKAYTAYDRGDYASAADHFKALVSTEKTAANYFYAGAANLEAGNTADAKTYFSVTLNYFGEFKEQAQWGMAMAALRENNINEALISLLSLKLNNSEYTNKVDEILETLEVLPERETGTGEAGWIDPPFPESLQGKTAFSTAIDETPRTYHLIVRGDNGRQYEIISNSPINAGPGDFVVFGILEEGTDGSPGLAYLIRVVGG